MEARKFGAAGARIVIEEILRGEEFSFFALCNGDDAIPLGLCQDHKADFRRRPWPQHRRHGRLLSGPAVPRDPRGRDCSMKSCARRCAR